jgi:hypothetical protein
VKAERPEAEQRNLLAFAALGAAEKKLYQLLVVEETRHIDETRGKLRLELLRGSGYAF